MESHSDLKVPYKKLGLSLAISYIVMLTVMFSRVNVPDNVFISPNQFYMTGMMVSPMLIIMLLTMGAMYKDKRLNTVLLSVGVVGILASWFLLRNQVGVNDQQFVRSMIPHHAAAITVCEQADLKDPRTIKLCEDIISAQKREIAEMKEIMKSPAQR
jgi:hypothetical protein